MSRLFFNPKTIAKASLNVSPSQLVKKCPKSVQATIKQMTGEYLKIIAICGLLLKSKLL